MTKLQSAEELWLPRGSTGFSSKAPQWFTDLIEARDRAVTQVCADAAYQAGLERVQQGKERPGVCAWMTDAILHAIDPPEDTRERLGRAAYRADAWNIPWEEAADKVKENYMKITQAVLAEQQLIEEERDE